MYIWGYPLASSPLPMCGLRNVFFCSPHSILELFINFLGVILFVAVGAICIEGRRNETLGLAIGILAIATGVVFLVDFVFAVRHTKFTTTTTTITRG